jgi:phosphate transport system substrate-binding protein
MLLNFSSSRQTICLASILFLLSAFATIYSSARAADVIHLCAATSVQKTFFPKIQEPFEKSAGAKLEFVKTPRSDPADYLKALMEGRCEAAVASISYEDWLVYAKAEKVQIPASAQITQRVVGRDFLILAANKSIGVTALALNQVVDIFTGKVKNWKEVGGTNLPVQILMPKDKESIQFSFNKMALKGKTLSPEAKWVPTFEETVKAIDSTPGAIAVLGSLNPGENTVSIKSTPSIGRPITLITMGRPAQKVEELISFIRNNSEQLNLKE